MHAWWVFVDFFSLFSFFSLDNAGRGGGPLGAGGVTIERGEECSGHGLCFRHAIDDDDDDKDGNGKDDAGGESALTTKQH